MLHVLRWLASLISQVLGLDYHKLSPFYLIKKGLNKII
jgi:hypothetical protein